MIKKSNLYKKSLEIKFENEEKLYTIRDLTLDVEFDMDMYFKLFNKKLEKYNIDNKNDFSVFNHIEDVIENDFTRDELKELARWGRANIIEFEKEEVSYYQIVLNLYYTLLNFQLFRYNLKKK